MRMTEMVAVVVLLAAAVIAVPLSGASVLVRFMVTWQQD